MSKKDKMKTLEVVPAQQKQETTKFARLMRKSNGWTVEVVDIPEDILRRLSPTESGAWDLYPMAERRLIVEARKTEDERTR